MGSPFTDEEKRFLLAEMIKVSRLDIETLGSFIRANGIEPNWMHMQLPLGRNMTQCMQAADHIGFGQRSWLKRKMSDDLSDSAAKRLALPGNLESAALAAAAPTHVAILPRPASSSADIAPAPAPAATTPPSTAPKKKGRPARADKARFRPILPQHIAPRPAEQNQQNQPHSQIDQQSQQSQNSQGYATPRTIVPTGPHNTEPSANFPSGGNYSTSYARPSTGRVNSEGGETPHNETLPRVIAELAHEKFEASRSNSLPGPIPLEPDPRASNPVQGRHDELTTLPPLLERDSKGVLMGSPRVENKAPVTNSV